MSNFFTLIFLIFSFSAFGQGQNFNTAFWKKRAVIAPAGLQLTHTPNNRYFYISWTAGSGVGSCIIQFKRVSSWTNVGWAFDCDANLTNQQLTLPTSANWTDANFDSTGLEVRIVKPTTLVYIASFPEKLTCTPISGSVTATPNVDEDCNKTWDNTATGSTPGCPATQNCKLAVRYTSSTVCMGTADLSQTSCSASTVTNGCTPVSGGRSLRISDDIGCSYDTTLYY